jgi:hypothetical protein
MAGNSELGSAGGSAVERPHPLAVCRRSDAHRHERGDGHRPACFLIGNEPRADERALCGGVEHRIPAAALDPRLAHDAQFIHMHAQHGGAVGHGVAQVPIRHRETQWLRVSEFLRRNDLGGPWIRIAAGRTPLAAKHTRKGQDERANLQALSFHDRGECSVVTEFCRCLLRRPRMT